MDITLLIAFVLCLLAFVVHTFVGDKEVQLLQPQPSAADEHSLREKWTMVRCGWHWISYDLLLATIALGMIIFTDILPNENYLLNIIAVLFIGYGVVWFLVVSISKSFPSNYLKLGQWLLLLLIGGLVALN